MLFSSPSPYPPLSREAQSNQVYIELNEQGVISGSGRAADDTKSGSLFGHSLEYSEIGVATSIIFS